MLFCQRCHKPAFLYRGLCEARAPELHATYNRELKYWSDLFDRFEAETGVSAVTDWRRFEKWVEALFARSRPEPNSTNDWYHLPGARPPDEHW
jgi:hypothetical protein